MLIYALAVFSLLLAALRPLWRYLAEYEHSGSEYAMEQYMQGLDEGRLRALAQPFFDLLDPALQSETQAFAEVQRIFENAHYALKSADAQQRHASYTIRSGDRIIGEIDLVKAPDPRLGFSPWEIENERYDFAWLLGSDEITVPDSYSVRCNGTALDESYLVGEPGHYAVLEELYGDERFQLPVLLTYRVDGVVGRAPFEVLSGDGQPADAAALPEEYELLANCSESEREQLRTLLDEFLPRYVACLSGATGSARQNYDALKPYMVAGSDVDRRVYDNMEGQAWAHSQGDTVESRADKLLMRLGNGYYLADISYVLDTVGGRGHVKSVNNAKIIICMTDDGPKAEEIYSY